MEKRLNKLNQIIQNFFIKAAQIILQSRTLPESDETEVPTDKLNKWFNLYIYNNNPYDIKIWKNQIDKNSSLDLISIPPMIIETYLDLRQLSPDQVVVLQDEHQNSWPVHKQKKMEIVLERWLIEFDPNEISDLSDDELPLIYKHSIVLFRALYGFARLLPTFKLKSQLLNDDSNLILKNNLIEGTQQISSKGRIGLSKSIIPHQLLTSDHITHTQFKSIQTTKGSLRISVAYRNQHQFSIQDPEQALSSHFSNFDKPTKQSPTRDNSTTIYMMNGSQRKSLDHEPIDMIKDLHRKSIDHELRKSLEEADECKSKINEDTDEYKSRIKIDVEDYRPNARFTASMSISPCTSGREYSPGVTKPTLPTKMPIQPFRVGSISSSSPPTGSTPTSSSFERRVSITSAKSTSNASLAALLRNPRGSNSSATSNIPITNTQSIYPQTVSGNFPRSISSSHGIEDGDGSAPRFSSSFGSRVSRRFSNTSNRQTTPLANESHNDLSLGTSAGLTSSTNAPLSGLYADDDISDFVKMIDSTADLRFGQGSVFNSLRRASEDQLNRFQLLRSTHQQIGDDLNASFHSKHSSPYYQTGMADRSLSRQSSPGKYSYIGRSRRSSTHSPHGSLQSEGNNFPSIHSRLQEKSGDEEEASSSRRSSFNKALFQKPIHPSRSSQPGTSPIIHESSLIHNKKLRVTKYESVFDDDEDEEENKKEAAASNKSERTDLNRNQSRFRQSPPPVSRSALHFQSNSSIQTPDDDDDLLFTMSDMNLAKN